MRYMPFSFALLALAYSPFAQAQTIYPLNRAEILAGSKFDIKVEFPGAPTQEKVSVMLNGKALETQFKTKPTFIEKEEGQDYSALVLRDVTLDSPGSYTITAKMGDQTKSVTWEVYRPQTARKAKNVILFVGDGLSVAHRTAARIMSKTIVEGRYGGELAIDAMPHMALVSTAGTDSIITDSANSMSAYTTGHKSCVNAMGVYCARNKNTLEHPKVEVISTLLKRKMGMAIGVVTNTEIEDATPAGVVAHTRRRSDYNDIVKMFYDVQPEVILGGGSPNFLPKSTPGSKRTDEVDYVKLFQSAGYQFVTTDKEMKAAAENKKTTKLLGLFNTVNIDGALDRMQLKKGSVDKFPDQPDLTDQVKTAISVLSKNDNGFFLMVESGRIDKYSHSLDAERAIFDVIMLDNAVKYAKDFAAKKNDTLIIVVGDHSHPVSIIGSYDDSLPGTTPREKLGIYAAAKFPNYPAPNAQGYPSTVDVSRRLAFNFGAYPDHCMNGKPYLDGENVPAIAGEKKGEFIANPKHCQQEGAVFRQGNLPVEANAGVHSGEDVVLTAIGPGAQFFKGHLENTKVFRGIVSALGVPVRDKKQK